MTRLSLGIASSIGVGLVETLCFDRHPSAWLWMVAFAPLVCLAMQRRWSRRRRFLLAWCCGTAFWSINVGWIAHTIGTHGGLPAPLALLLLFLLALYMGLYWALFVWIAGLLSSAGGKGVRAVVLHASGLASVWVVLEILREWLFTGFPWSPLGEALVRVPGALDASAVVGVRGLSFVVLVVNAVVAHWALSECASRGRDCDTGWVLSVGAARMLASATLVVVALGLGLSAWHGHNAETSVGEPENLPIRVVQPNVPINPPAVQVVANYQRLLSLSQCEGDELIVWPESAAYPYSWSQHRTLQRDVRRVLAERCALLFNSALQVALPDRSVGFTNTALLAQIDPQNAGEIDLQRYDKVHLVPYGEYVPLKQALPFVGQLARSVGEFERGTEPTLLQWREALFGISICFEVLFPGEVAQRVRLGASALMVLTNDAWFGDSRAPHQHLISARFRAAENRRPVVFAAVTGTSALIDTRGRVVSSLPLDTAGTLSADLVADLGHRRDAKWTVYSRFGRLIDAAALLLFALTCAMAALERQRTTD